ncbi:MAG: SoxR reducing system RseC family protein [Lachnoclostridium sp.]|nr:SoxR reducing system RseC family protein [Lachnoclostridium sp.]
MHSDHVEHKGIVEKVTFNSIVIRVDEPCQCQGCAIAVVCSGKTEGEDSGEVIVIPRPRDRQFNVGDRVALEATSGSQLRATFFSFILPTIILAAVILSLYSTHPGWGFWIVLLAVAAVAVYDLILFLFRKDLAMSVHWQIRHC